MIHQSALQHMKPNHCSYIALLKVKHTLYECLLEEIPATHYVKLSGGTVFPLHALRTPYQGLISFTYIVRFPLADRYWLLVA